MRWEMEMERKGTWTSSKGQLNSELKKTKMRNLVVYTSAYIQLHAGFKAQLESQTLVQLY